MRTFRWLQLDVFADRPGAGNPLGVVVDAQGLDAATMQAIAAWTNLSETIFLLPVTEATADYRVRIFTPRQELPFAGHPSVGAAWAVLDQRLAQPRDGTLVQECAAGLLPVAVVQDAGGQLGGVQVRAPRAHREAAANQHWLAAATSGWPLSGLAPALWNNGPAWWLVQLDDDAAVRGLEPDLAAIAALTRATGAVGLAVFGVATGTDHDLAVRAFCPADNIPEDPVTGSANACIAAAMHAAGTLPPGGSLVASQGRELGRDGRIDIRVEPDGEVWIGGAVQALVRGELSW